MKARNCMQVLEKKLIEVENEDEEKFEVLDTLRGKYKDLEVEVYPTDVFESDMYVIRINREDKLIGAVDIDSCASVYLIDRYENLDDEDLDNIIEAVCEHLVQF